MIAMIQKSMADLGPNLKRGNKMIMIRPRTKSRKTLAGARLAGGLFQLSILAFVASIFGSTSGFAQESLTPKLLSRNPSSAEEKVLGWKPELSLAGNLSFTSNDQVIGQQSGDTTTLGANLNGGLNYSQERYEWRNSLKVLAANTKTPNIPRYVKSTDELKLESIYMYTLEAVPWLGPYARASAETSLFVGEDTRESATTYSITRGSAAPETASTATLRLTDPYKPLTTRQSVGAFAKISTSQDLQLEARLGFGAIQVAAAGQLSLDDKKNTPEIEVKELKDFTQAGLEGGLTFKGLIDEKTSYSLGAEFLTPFIKDLEPGDDRDSLELTNYEVIAKLSSKVVSWLSVNYEYKLKKQPQLLDKNQTQHAVLLSLSYTLF